MPYRLTESAAADLTNIWQYTYEQWGEGQADRYLYGIDNCCNGLGDKPLLGKPCAELDPDLRVYRFEHHYIFYLIDNSIPTIIAVLHERMDILGRVKHRLDPPL